MLIAPPTSPAAARRYDFVALVASEAAARLPDAHRSMGKGLGLLNPVNSHIVRIIDVAACCYCHSEQAPVEDAGHGFFSCPVCRCPCLPPGIAVADSATERAIASLLLQARWTLSKNKWRVPLTVAIAVVLPATLLVEFFTEGSLSMSRLLVGALIMQAVWHLRNFRRESRVALGNIGEAYALAGIDISAFSWARNLTNNAGAARPKVSSAAPDPARLSGVAEEDGADGDADSAELADFDRRLAEAQQKSKEKPEAE